jgi:hypothetical protein
MLFRAVTHGHFRLLLSGWPNESGTLVRAFTHGYFNAPHELGRITGSTRLVFALPKNDVRPGISGVGRSCHRRRQLVTNGGHAYV